MIDPDWTSLQDKLKQWQSLGESPEAVRGKLESYEKGYIILKGRFAEIKAERLFFVTKHKALQEENKKLREEMERLREVLGKYANPDNWGNIDAGSYDEKHCWLGPGPAQKALEEL